MNTKETKYKLFKLMIYSILVMLIILSLKGYYYYEEMKAEVIADAKKEAHLLQDYMMSVRETFHKQFLASEIKLTDKTLGFLPAHATTIISNKFQKKNDYNFYIRNVSDTPRNKTNMADKEEMKAIEFFKKNSQEVEYFKKCNDGSKEYFQFASPIYIKPYCLACHGKREEALPTIRERYKTAYDYKVGDIRGIVSIKIPNDKINTRFHTYLKRELLMTLIIFILVSILFFIIFRKVFFQISNMEKKAITYASKDALTGLYNRKYLNDFLQKHENYIQENQQYVVAFLDIDYFKKINDTYGHDMGDSVLKEFALLLKSLSREEDIVCRYGGEEFLVIVYNISLEKAVEKFNKIKTAIENKTIELNNNIMHVTVSIGLAVGGIEDSVYNVISNADKALYKAKENGRNCIEIFKKDF